MAQCYRWSHEYQEATIEKILRFLKGGPSQEQPDTAKTDQIEPQKKWQINMNIYEYILIPNIQGFLVMVAV